MRALELVGGMLETVVRALAKSDLFGALSAEQLRKIAQRGELLQCTDGATSTRCSSGCPASASA